jgi:hypothetical protein
VRGNDGNHLVSAGAALCVWVCALLYVPAVFVVFSFQKLDEMPLKKLGRVCSNAGNYLVSVFCMDRRSDALTLE